MNSKMDTNSKLNESYSNYYNIIKQKLPYKFAYLDDWLLKQSEMLSQETDNIKKKENKNIQSTYRVYKRGTIIKIDFGIGLGSEMSQIHFAIVLNNYDNPKNNVLTIIPLTSKKHKYNLSLGNLVVKELINNLEKEITKIGIKEEFNFNIAENNRKFQKITTIMSYYKTNIKDTYACTGMITTISKTRIIKPINEYDVIGKIKCSPKILDMIDKEILDKITKNT